MGPRQHNAHRIVQHHLLARLQTLNQFRVDPDPHLAATRIHVDRPIVVDLQHRAIGRRRLGEFLHLVTKRRNALPGSLNGGRQLLVSCIGTRQFPFGVANLGLQTMEFSGRLDQATTQLGNLAFKIDRQARLQSRLAGRLRSTGSRLPLVGSIRDLVHRPTLPPAFDRTCVNGHSADPIHGVQKVGR